MVACCTAGLHAAALSPVPSGAALLSALPLSNNNATLAIPPRCRIWRTQTRGWRCLRVRRSCNTSTTPTGPRRLAESAQAWPARAAAGQRMQRAPQGGDAVGLMPKGRNMNASAHFISSLRPGVFLVKNLQALVSALFVAQAVAVWGDVSSRSPAMAGALAIKEKDGDTGAMQPIGRTQHDRERRSGLNCLHGCANGIGGARRQSTTANLQVATLK